MIAMSVIVTDNNLIKILKIKMVNIMFMMIITIFQVSQLVSTIVGTTAWTQVRLSKIVFLFIFAKDQR